MLREVNPPANLRRSKILPPIRDEIREKGESDLGVEVDSIKNKNNPFLEMGRGKRLSENEMRSQIH